MLWGAAAFVVLFFIFLFVSIGLWINADDDLGKSIAPSVALFYGVPCLGLASVCVAVHYAWRAWHG
jgi:hypothetical protein